MRPRVKPSRSTRRGAAADATWFRLLAENAQDVIYRFRVAPPRGAEYVSPAALTITGHRPEEFYADPELTMRAIHPDDRHLVAEAYQDDPARLQRSILVRWVHPDGRIVFAEHRRMPVVGADGRMIAIEGVGRDVTERVDAERRLADSERRFRLLAETSSDMIYRFYVTPELRTEYISPAAVKITGHTPDEFYRDPTLALRLLHPDDRPAAERMMMAPAEFTSPFVLRWVHPDGTVVPAEHRIVPDVAADGTLVSIAGLGRDVTETIAAPERLRASEAQLRRLAASIEEAREKERALIARELHDELGQSLTAMKLELTRMVRVLTPQGLPLEAIDGLQSIIGGVDVATETVRRLATSLRPPALDHLGLVAAIELEAAALARRTGVRCRVVGNRRVTRLDPARSVTVFRIVQEALTNAIRHASASAIRISIHSTARTTTVHVQDNGRGISNEAIEDPSAIGLVGMRERAELIGARLTVSSTPGKGTTVSMVVQPPSAASGERLPA
jgi:PAS domain S-box-containing protein